MCRFGIIDSKLYPEAAANVLKHESSFSPLEVMCAAEFWSFLSRPKESY